MSNIEHASPEHRKALAAVITAQAEEILTRAQHLDTEAKALYRAAHLLFGDADRLDPTEKFVADNDDTAEHEFDKLMDSLGSTDESIAKLVAELGDPDLDEAA